MTVASPLKKILFPGKNAGRAIYGSCRESLRISSGFTGTMCEDKFEAAKDSLSPSQT